MKLLVFHEYAHIAHIDNATGVPALVNLALFQMERTRQTVVFDLPVEVMTPVVPTPSEVRRMIRARHACFCEVLRSATMASRRRRSAAETEIVLRHNAGDVGKITCDQLRRLIDAQAVVDNHHLTRRQVVGVERAEAFRNRRPVQRLAGLDHQLAEGRIRFA